ncbi:MAG: ribonucleotide reductase N-terminal alpha domain-containing protein, partial [Gammaproteobacteria bacterium]
MNHDADNTRDWLTSPIARHIWASKYRWQEKGGVPEAGIEATWRRVAHAAAAVETAERARWEARFFDSLR